MSSDSPNVAARAEILLATLLILAGFVIACASYGKLEPGFWIISVTLVGLVVMSAPGVFTRSDRIGFYTAVSVGWLTAAVAAVYANQFNDPGSPDAQHFHSLSLLADGRDMNDLTSVTEGAAAVVIWRKTYALANLLHLGSGQYVGIAINVAFVAAACVLGGKIVETIFEQDDFRLRQFRIIFLTSGTIWLFAGTHLRDAMILLAVTAWTLIWVVLVSKVTALRVAIVAAGSVLTAHSLYYLRAELVHVPAAMALAGGAALCCGTSSGKLSASAQRMTGALIVVAALVYFGWTASDIAFWAERNLKFYSLGSNSAPSLGSSLIVSAPFPVRAVLGSAYVWLFPIPVWIGLAGNDVYMLFKSAQALFSYIWLPLMGLSCFALYPRTAQTPSLLFLLFCTLGFTVAIAITSIETRHLGAFLAAPYAFSTLANMRSQRIRRIYCILVGQVLFIAGALHGCWLFLKS